MTTPENPAPSAPLASLLPPVQPGRRHNGKVARLQKSTRDKINIMLDDGFTYAEIIKELGVEGTGLNEENIGSWKATGYQDWLREQQRIQILRAKQDFALDLACEGDGSKIHQATLQIAATNLCELLVDLDPAAMRESFEENPDKYTRLLNAIARISDGELKCERHCTDQAQRLAKIQKDKAATEKRGISDETLKTAEQRLNLM